jgi:hypothetical protein
MQRAVIFTPEAVAIIGIFYGGQDYETVLQLERDN